MSITDKQTNMTAEEAIAIIEREIACVNKECNIERACGQCELVMPSKEPIIEAYKLAIEALKAKPCTDAVSRQTVLDTLDTAEKFLDEDRTVERYKDMLTAAYEMLPPVIPKDRKVSE